MSCAGDCGCGPCQDGAIYSAGAGSLTQTPGLLDLSSLPPGVAPLPGTPLPETFTWDGVKGQSVLDAATAAPGTSPVLAADDFRQALMTTLFHAEELAVVAGFSVTIPAPDGTQGYMIGAGLKNARLAAAKGDPNGLLYLSIYNGVDGALQKSKAAPPTTAAGAYLSSANLVGVAPLLIAAGVFVVVALASIVAGAYILSQKVVADADSLARVNRCAQAAQLARDGKPVPADLCPPEPTRTTAGPLAGTGMGFAVGLGAAVLLLFMVKR